MMMLVALIPAAVGLAISFQPTFRLVLWAAAAFAPALLLGFALRFTLEWTLALAAFWVTRVSAINQMYWLTLLFLSGEMAPLALLPKLVQYVAAVSPFRWMIGFPVELLLGRMTPGAALLGFAAQAVWLALSLALLRLVWRAGVRRYSAVGA